MSCFFGFSCQNLSSILTLPGQNKFFTLLLSTVYKVKIMQWLLGCMCIFLLDCSTLIEDDSIGVNNGILRSHNIFDGWKIELGGNLHNQVMLAMVVELYQFHGKLSRFVIRADKADSSLIHPRVCLSAIDYPTPNFD